MGDGEGWATQGITQIGRAVRECCEEEDGRRGGKEEEDNSEN